MGWATAGAGWSGQGGLHLPEQRGDFSEAGPPAAFVGVARAAELARGGARTRGFEPRLVLTDAGGFSGTGFGSIETAVTACQPALTPVDRTGTVLPF